LPREFTGYSTTAEITVTADGRFVYCSNRAHNSIAIFGQRNERYTDLRRWEPTQGPTSRFIGLDPTRRFLFAANDVPGPTPASSPTGRGQLRKSSHDRLRRCTLEPPPASPKPRSHSKSQKRGRIGPGRMCWAHARAPTSASSLGPSICERHAHGWLMAGPSLPVCQIGLVALYPAARAN
jgi:Lactonase, 7-bladed beta-propeller